jgi:hypothetical protein
VIGEPVDAYPGIRSREVASGGGWLLATAFELGIGRPCRVSALRRRADALQRQMLPGSTQEHVQRSPPSLARDVGWTPA